MPAERLRDRFNRLRVRAGLVLLPAASIVARVLPEKWEPVFR